MKQKSLTLVEIIVSMVILSLVLSGIAGIFVAGKRYLKRAEFKQTALNFAREKLEELEALDFDDNRCDDDNGSLEAGSYPTLSCPDTATLPPDWSRTWTIIDDATPPDFKTITITVQWQEP